MFQEEVVGGRAMAAGEAAAGADQLDLEAAEQLIQLSGGDGDGGSESRSADSVKCRGADHRAGMEEEETEVAVESRRRRMRSAGRFGAGKGGGGGGGGEPVRRSTGTVKNKCSTAAGTGEKGGEKEPVVESRKRGATGFLDGKDPAGGVDDGEERRRPRFRWLADIYRETRRQVTARDPGVAGGNFPPEAEGSRKRRRAAAADEDEVVVPMAVMSKESKERTMAA